jgi:hypothetical protein
MFVPCIVLLGIIDQHYVMSISPLFITQSSTCFGIHMPGMRSAGQRNARNYNNQCTQATNIYNT